MGMCCCDGRLGLVPKHLKRSSLFVSNCGADPLDSAAPRGGSGCVATQRWWGSQSQSRPPSGRLRWGRIQLGLEWTLKCTPKGCSMKMRGAGNQRSECYAEGGGILEILELPADRYGDALSRDARDAVMPSRVSPVSVSAVISHRTKGLLC
jgi:hypothetical protein